MEDVRPRQLNAPLGRYEIRTRLGAGGMGEVYLAWDTQLERPVALKLLHPEVAADEQRLRRFIQEARAASALNHPNILTVHEIGQSENSFFIATEFIDGVTLRERLSGGAMRTEELVDVAAQVASALQAAHAAGIVHRDIKPENIMLRKDGYVKVLDFGLAKLVAPNPFLSGEAEDMEAPTLVGINTRPGVIMGTLSYMSPEQARGLPIDARTDIWSFGVVLYEMVAGRVPFAGDTSSDVLAFILHHDYTPLSLLAPNVPARLVNIVNKALAKNREGRYASTQEMLSELRALKQRLDFDATFGALEREERGAGASPETRGSGANQYAPTISDIPSSASQEHPNNLTAEISPLVGRAEEIAAIGRLLLQEEVRLVTLTGIGGTGKTRLARAVAHSMVPEFSDGVFLVELASINDPELVMPAVSQVLGVKEEGGAVLIESLKKALRGLRMLLVLDNFEQVVEAAPRVAELLAAAPQLKVLVTSRALLRVSAEREFTVPALKLPPKDGPATLQELARCEAVALFVERAAAVKPSFRLTDENAGPVVEICARLDGLPLAIELAAARVRVLTPQAILSRLENRLQLLTGGLRDLPARQQTMRGAISWSYDLLDEDERKLLNRLSVFAGGSTLPAIEAVCNAEGDLRVEPLDGVISLLDKSLLVQREQSDGESRFGMLELVREYSAERLKETGDASSTMQRHADFFMALVEEAEPELLGKRAAQWLDRLEEEHDNLRAALRWTLANDPQSCLLLTGSLWRFWSMRGHYTEGRGWLETALEKEVESTSFARAKALHGAGSMAWQRGELGAARRSYEDSLAISRRMDYKLLIAGSLNGLGIVAQQSNDLPKARAFFEECLTVGKELGDDRLTAIALSNLATVAVDRGDWTAARRLYEESLELFREAGNKGAVIINLANLGEGTYQQGDLSASGAYYREALALAQELGDKRVTAASFDGFAALAARKGEWEKAARLAGAAHALYEATGYELEPSSRLFRERYLEQARAALGEQKFKAHEAEGRAMKVRAAVRLALE